MDGLDLFSGIGGLTKALEGYVTPIAYCEKDRYAIGVLLSRMHSGDLPTAPIWDDVLTLHGTMLPQIEIVYGGFPCQDISVAGRRAGLAGKRSGLFFEIVRIVGEIRPKFIFLENVPNIRTTGAEVVVGELARLGYDCRWDVLFAADVGANHRRERWWLLAHARHGYESQWAWSTRWDMGEPAAKREEFRRDGSHGDVADAASEQDNRKRGDRECRRNAMGRDEQTAQQNNGEADHDGISRCGQDVADTMLSGLEGNASQRIQRETRRGDEIQNAEPTGNGGWWAVEPNVGRVAHGVPFRVDRLRGLGNAVVPAQAREAFERLMGLKSRAEADWPACGKYQVKG